MLYTKQITQRESKMMGLSPNGKALDLTPAFWRSNLVARLSDIISIFDISSVKNWHN